MRKRITLTLTEEDMGWIRRAFGSADLLDEPGDQEASEAALEKLETAWDRGSQVFKRARKAVLTNP